MTTPAQPAIGWITTPDKQGAEVLAENLITNDLCACAQISGPITSCYKWDGKLHKDKEYRITVKFNSHHADGIGLYLEKHHPYDTPQWIWIRAEGGLEEYLDWIMQSG